jgi:alkylated DNA repair dioxygenase AlkB
MTLFPANPIENLLPFDGTVNYFGKIISQQEANHYYNLLMNNIEWRNDEAIIFGKHIITARKVAWYADENFPYTYSNTTKQALAWTKELLELKEIAEKLSGTKYNSCLLNLYHNGNEGMAYHSDDEKSLGKNTSIASMSFGAERKFLFKHKTNKQTMSLLLEHGSLLIMKDTTQTYWLHRLPTTTKINTPRINLTFRTMVI